MQNKLLKYFLILLVALALVGGYFFYRYFTKKIPHETQTQQITDETAGWKTYTNAEYGFKFKYPDNLTLEQKSGMPSLTHKVFYPHPDPCNWKDGAPIDNIIDFQIIISIINKDINSAIASDEGAQGANIEKINIGGLDGFKYMLGVEYCGYNFYYLSILPQKTLVIKSPIVTEISPITAKEEVEKYLKIPSIINNTEAGNLLSKVISTFKFTK